MIFFAFLDTAACAIFAPTFVGLASLTLRARRIRSPDHTTFRLLFSGGVDSLYLAALMAESELNSRFSSVQLCNVSFQDGCVDRVQSRAAFSAMQRMYGDRIKHWSMKEINVTRDQFEDTLQHAVLPLVFPRD